MAGIPFRPGDGAGNSHWTPPVDEDEEEEEELTDAAYKTAKDAVLFAIDVSKSMLTSPSESDPKKPETGLSPTIAALKCAYALMQQRIISNPNDMMGILLFGTEKSRFQDADDQGNVGLQYPHCYLLTDLDVPAAADVKLVRDIVQDEEEAAELLQASTDEVTMANVLFCANQIFTTKAPNFTSRRLFLVTDNDLPHSENRALRNSAAVRAKDLYDLGVTIELFPISHPDRGYVFDRSKFYNDIVYSSVPSDPDAPAPLNADIKAANSTANDGISLLQSLLSSIASRSAPRRALFSSTPFEIGPGLKISVKGYAIMMKQKPKRTAPVYVPPDSEKAQIAVSTSTMTAMDETARTVEKTEIRKAYKFGGESVTFTEEELARITDFGEPVIRIIGFKPMDSLPVWATLKTSTFIYPSEDSFIGSTRIFSALHQKLLKSRKVGIAWYIPRRNSGPRLAAVIPGAEERNQDGDQQTPPGLWLKPLPFADDVRQPPQTHLVKAPDSVVDAMRLVIQNLMLPKAIYDPSKYPNPSLQWFFRILQALALEEDLPELPEDKTLPRWKQIHKRVGGYVVDWGHEVQKAYDEWCAENGNTLKPTTTGASKRSTAVSASSGPSKVKKIKDEDDDEGVTDAALRAAYDADKVSKFKVPELKGWCAGKGIGKGLTKKQDLVDAITSFFETKMEVD